MLLGLAKKLLPNHPTVMTVYRGPFRGARILVRPRQSMRKVFGLYEHELNPWLNRALQRVERVLDVGANDGYFTFGCAAAFRRLGKRGTIVAFEPNPQHVELLNKSMLIGSAGSTIEVQPTLVGASDSATIMRLDSLVGHPRERTLVKIDVEGAEVDVLQGAHTWLSPTNLFLIEVHAKPLLQDIRDIFRGSGTALDRIDQRPLPVLGREVRDENNWWLVSRLYPES